MPKKQETQAQLEKRVKKDIEDKRVKELAEKQAKEKKENNAIFKVSGKGQKDLALLNYNAGFKAGQIKILEKQLREKEEQEAKPVTIADQLKVLEEKIKYARLQELKKINDRKIISIINSLAHELEITMRSLLALEKEGLVQHISREDYENDLRKIGQKSRINSTTRKNLNIILWAIEELKLCQTLLVGGGLTGNRTGEIPLELYPVDFLHHNREKKRYFKLAERRKRKAEAILKKQQKDQD